MQQDEGARLPDTVDEDDIEAVAEAIGGTKDRGEIRTMLQTYADAKNAKRAKTATACP